MTPNTTAGIGLSLSFNDFLSSKGLEYKTFEPHRFSQIYSKIESNFSHKPTIIQIIGTNGKGSTANFLAQMLCSLGKSVGLYTSPHLYRFNERISLDFVNITDNELENEHKKLQFILDIDDLEAISYFEYTTLLAYSYLCSRCDYLILEAGLGGEFDATSAFEKKLLLVSQIDIDHTDMLGSSLGEIATTKLRAINCDTVIMEQSLEVMSIAKNIAGERAHAIFVAEESLSLDEKNMCKSCCESLNMPSFFAKNMMLSLAGFKQLGFEVNESIMPKNKISGRFDRLNDHIVVDVGHNEACARAVKSELKNKKVQLVYNSMREKDFESVLLLLKPNIAELEIMELDSQRALCQDRLEQFLDRNSIKYKSFAGVEQGKEYLVFGSFLVVQKFMEEYFEK